MIVQKNSFTVHFVNSDTEKTVQSLEEAKQLASAYCGNSSYTKPFPNENTYLYGPGDGTTSVMVRQDFEFVDAKV